MINYFLLLVHYLNNDILMYNDYQELENKKYNWWYKFILRNFRHMSFVFTFSALDDAVKGELERLKFR